MTKREAKLRLVQELLKSQNEACLRDWKGLRSFY